jgi:hypothetical protein
MMTAASARRTFALLAAGLLFVSFAVSVSSQPVPTNPKTDARVDHEGFPLPDEAIARVGSARFRTGAAIMAHAKKSATQHRKNSPFNNDGLCAIDSSLFCVRS